MKKETFIRIIYGCAAIGFITYLATQKSVYMFCGGLLLTIASVMVIMNNKNKK